MKILPIALFILIGAAGIFLGKWLDFPFPSILICLICGILITLSFGLQIFHAKAHSTKIESYSSQEHINFIGVAIFVMLGGAGSFYFLINELNRHFRLFDEVFEAIVVIGIICIMFIIIHIYLLFCYSRLRVQQKKSTQSSKRQQSSSSETQDEFRASEPTTEKEREPEEEAHLQPWMRKDKSQANKSQP